MLVHVPHASLYIPEDSVMKDSLSLERLTETTDLYADLLFKPDSPHIEYLVFDHNKFYCDINKSFDPVNYMAISENCDKIRTLYYKWHIAIQNICIRYFNTYGECVFIDAHTFSENDCEFTNENHPDIYLGYNSDTHRWLIEEAIIAFSKSGYDVEDYFSNDIKVFKQSSLSTNSLTININKRIYLNSDHEMKVENFKKLHHAINRFYYKVR